jgi:hypothetical protein
MDDRVERVNASYTPDRGLMLLAILPQLLHTGCIQSPILHYAHCVSIMNTPSLLPDMLRASLVAAHACSCRWHPASTTNTLHVDGTVTAHSQVIRIRYVVADQPWRYPFQNRGRAERAWSTELENERKSDFGARAVLSRVVRTYSP